VQIHCHLSSPNFVFPYEPSRSGHDWGIHGRRQLLAPGLSTHRLAAIRAATPH
jgi:hypothetical protein